jgi:hypothetical protein
MSCFIVALVLTLALAGGGCAGSANEQSTPAALKLQREDLAAVARELMTAETAVSLEVTETKRVWPLLSGPVPTSAADGASHARHSTKTVTGLKTPTLFGELQARSLTGPAASIAGLFRYSVLLTTRGWKMVFASSNQMSRGSPTAARFARENIGLYVESIYDGHFGLAQIGKKLLAAYEKLGGPPAFASTLTQAEVDALARAYSEASLRLHPHPHISVGS